MGRAFEDGIYVLFLKGNTYCARLLSSQVQDIFSLCVQKNIPLGFETLATDNGAVVDARAITSNTDYPTLKRTLAQASTNVATDPKAGG